MLFIQFIGLLAGLFLILSYFRKDTNKVLSFSTAAGQKGEIVSEATPL